MHAAIPEILTLSITINDYFNKLIGKIHRVNGIDPLVRRSIAVVDVAVEYRSSGLRRAVRQLHDFKY